MRKALVIGGAILVAVLGGWELTGVIARLPMEMPGWFDDFLRWLLRAVGAAKLEDTDDMEVVAFLLTFAVCVTLIGVVEAAFWFAIRRLRLR
ncbi:hypothetical protein [Trinickia acidisoli]|uniref:hypothetical protein n=1 Tax=Trinickia acidisoli TaxID=2767482 RepID=UPI001A8C7D4F|nr:hypothetical protein [Trinickia acidisoli]